MTNQELGWQLHKIADYLQLAGVENDKVSDFRNGAEVIGEKCDLAGFPPQVQVVIQQLLTTGEAELLNMLKKKVPHGLVEMLDIPRVTGDIIYAIYWRLGIDNITDLEEAIKKRKIRQLPKMGSKTELTIMRGIKMLREPPEQVPLGIAKTVAQAQVKDLVQHPAVERGEIVGQVSMGEEMVSKVEIIFSSSGPEQVFSLWAKHPQLQEIITRKDTTLTFRTKIGVMVEFISVPRDNFAGYSHYFTGTKQYMEAMALVAQQYGVNLKDLSSYNYDQEEELFAAFNMDYIPPQWRRSIEMVQAGVEGRLPKPVQQVDIKGDLHCHSNWSDGTADIEEMALAARELGYEYLAMTDHSQSLKIANGLSEVKLSKQGEEIKAINDQWPDFHLLRGVETDILKDGSLDYPDQVLAEMEVVIASVHTHFQLSSLEMTERIITAMKNPYINILAHPTGRILGRRDGYAVDMDQVLQVAAVTNTVLEINSTPDRLDLDHQLAAQAQELGVKLSINTDSHGPANLTDIEYGITVAQKALLKSENVINTYKFEELKKFLKKQKGK